MNLTRHSLFTYVLCEQIVFFTDNSFYFACCSLSVRLEKLLIITELVVNYLQRERETSTLNKHSKLVDVYENNGNFSI